MTDDLVKRLRESGTRSEVELHEDREEAADRIEELEAKLEKAVEALDRIQHGSYGKNAAMARTALKQLAGGKDE